MPPIEPIGAGTLQLCWTEIVGVREGARVMSERDGGSELGMVMASGRMCSSSWSLAAVLQGEPSSPLTNTVLETVGLMAGLGGTLCGEQLLPLS